MIAMASPELPATPDLRSALRRLRLEGRFDAARELLAERLEREQSPKLALLARQHAPFWWEPLRGPHVVLRRRGPEDLALVRRAWGDATFMKRFNRAAAPLPHDDAAVRSLLWREQCALPEESRAVHWTICVQGEGVGFASLVEIAFGHRRAEFLVGVMPGSCSRGSGRKRRGWCSSSRPTGCASGV